MNFRKIGSERRYVLVARQIIESIQSGNYRVGSKLPPEREIASQMGVARPSVREALVALNVVGILDSKQGDGIYVVREVNDIQQGWQANSILKNDESPFEAFQIREILEPLVIQLIELPNEELVNALRVTLKRMSKTVKKTDYSAFLIENRTFHHLLVQAAGNNLLSKIMNSLIEVTKNRLWSEMSRSYLENHLQDSFEIHNRIFGSIEKCDKNQALSYLMQHYQLIKSYFKK